MSGWVWTGTRCPETSALTCIAPEPPRRCATNLAPAFVMNRQPDSSRFRPHCRGLRRTAGIAFGGTPPGDDEPGRNLDLLFRWARHVLEFHRVQMDRSVPTETATPRYQIIEPAEYGTRDCTVDQAIKCPRNDRTKILAGMVARIDGSHHFEEGATVIRPDQVCRCNGKDRRAPEHCGRDR